MSETLKSEVLMQVSAKKTSKPFGTVLINYIENPLDPINSKKPKMDIHGRPLSEYLPTLIEDEYIEVSLNGQILQDFDFEGYIVQPNDVISYVTYVAGGGDSKSIFSMIAMIGLSLVAFGVPGMAGSGFFATGGIAGAYGIAAGIATMVVGSLLISSLFAPNLDIPSISTPEAESQSYSWTGAETNRSLNVPIPVLYGTFGLTGTVINNRFYYNEFDDWISVQLSLCHGEIENIEFSDIYINDNEYSSYITEDSTDANIGYEVVNGTFDQRILKGFSDSIYNNVAISRKLTYNEPYTFTTTSTNINLFRLHFECPNGLYVMDKSTGDKSEAVVELDVKYRRVGDTTWTPLVSKVPVYTTEYEHKKQLAASYSTFWSTKSSSTSYTYTDIYGNVVSAQTTLTGNTRLVESSYTTMSKITLKSSSSTPYKLWVEPVLTSELKEGQYEFEVTRLTEPPYDDDDEVYEEDHLHQNITHVRLIEEIQTADLNYGGIANIGFHIRATEQLANTRPNFKIITTRKDLYLKGQYRPSNNPAWVCYDIITNKEYGMGRPEEEVAFTEFERWAEFCDGGIGEYFEVANLIPTADNTTIRSNYLIIPYTDYTDNLGLTLAGLNYNTSSLVVTSSYFNSATNSITEVEYGVRDIIKIEEKYITNDAVLADGYYNILYFPRTLKPDSYVEYSLFHTTEGFVNTPKLKFNGTFDSTEDIWNTVQSVAKIGRGQIVLQGTNYSVIFDEPKLISGLYNSSNANNFKVTYIGETDLASEMEISFADSSIRYEMNTISIQEADATAAGVSSNKTSVTPKGITTEEEALIYGRYELATNKYLRRLFSFDANIEAITQSIGDLIAIQTDVTQYGKGGVIVKKVGNASILDTVVYLEKDREYTLKIKNNKTDVIKDYNFIAGNIEPTSVASFDSILNIPVGELVFDDFSLLITNYDGDTYETQVIIHPEGYEIEAGDKYSFGLKGSDSFLATITNISREGDLTRKIEAKEYNESILDFDYDNDILQRVEVTKRPRNSILNIKASDRLVKTLKNETVSMISFSWESNIASSYNIYILEGSFKRYLAKGIKGNRYEYAAIDLVAEQEYTFYVEDITDIKIVSSFKYTITAFSAIPDTIDDFTLSIFDNKIRVELDYTSKPLDFKHYEVYYKGAFLKTETSDTFDIYPGIGWGDIEVKIRPVDMIGKIGEVTVRTLNIIPPEIINVNAELLHDKISLEILTNASSFDIKEYQVSYDNYNIISKSNIIEIPSSWSGNKSLSIRATDVIGNISDKSYSRSVALSIPNVTNLTSTLENGFAKLSWNTPNTTHTIEYYEISYDGFVFLSKSNSYSLPITWLGTKTFTVKLVNTYGVKSSGMSTEVTISTSSIYNPKVEVVDNNVLIRWEYIYGSLPIDYVKVYKGETLGTLTLIGDKKGTFTTVFENSAGTYSYWLSAVDSAGNEGVKTKVVATVSAPPDYVLNVLWDSDFSGTISNGEVDSGKLYFPVNNAETFEQHFTINSWSTPEDQVNAGYPLWIEPLNVIGYYEEVFDYGTILSSTINLTLDYEDIIGTSTLDWVVSISTDGVTYTDYPNQIKVFGTNFRYVKIRVNAQAPVGYLTQVNKIELKLESKQKNDSGSGSAVSTDVDGTVVYFNTTFVDIISINVTPQTTTPVITTFSFDDVPTPTQFEVFLWDINGNRVNGAFSWSAKGY